MKTLLQWKLFVMTTNINSKIFIKKIDENLKEEVIIIIIIIFKKGFDNIYYYHRTEGL